MKRPLPLIRFDTVARIFCRQVRFRDDQVCTALTHRGAYLSRTGPAIVPKLPGVRRQVREPACAPISFLLGHAAMLGAGTADPAALEDSGACRLIAANHKPTLNHPGRCLESLLRLVWRRPGFSIRRQEG